MIQIRGIMREEISEDNIIKVFIAILLFSIVSCAPIKKEGSEKVEVEVELRYDNGTTQLGPLIKYMVLDY